MSNQSKILCLRRMSVQDYNTVEPWFNSPDNTVWLKSVYKLGRYSPLLHRKSIEESGNYFCIGDINKYPVGFVGLSFINRVDRSAMIWYVVGKSKGNGVGSVLVNNLIQIAFGDLGLHSVYATVAASNEASCKVLLKNNFQRVGVQRASHRINDFYEDRLIFDLVSGEQPKRIQTLARWDNLELF